MQTGGAMAAESRVVRAAQALQRRRRRRYAMLSLLLGAWIAGLYFMIWGKGLVNYTEEEAMQFIELVDQVGWVWGSTGGGRS